MFLHIPNYNLLLYRLSFLADSLIICQGSCSKLIFHSAAGSADRLAPVKESVSARFLVQKSSEEYSRSGGCAMMDVLLTFAVLYATIFCDFEEISALFVSC